MFSCKKTSQAVREFRAEAVFWGANITVAQVIVKACLAKGISADKAT